MAEVDSMLESASIRAWLKFAAIMDDRTLYAAVSGVAIGLRSGRSWRRRVNTYTAINGSTAITSTATWKPRT